MRIPISYGRFLLAGVVGLVGCLYAAARMSPAELAPITLGGVVVCFVVLGLLPWRLDCPSCGERACARLTFGYREGEASTDQVAPKLECPDCGLLVRVSDFPPRFEKDT